MCDVISGTYVSIESIAKLLAQIEWSEERLGKGVKENKQAIDYHLGLTNSAEQNKDFWDNVEKQKEILNNLFDEDIVNYLEGK